MKGRRGPSPQTGENLKLIRLLIAAIAISLAFGATAGQATAKPSIAKQAKKLCKAKKGKAKKACVKKQTKRLKAKAERERQKELNKPGVTIRTTEGGVPRIVADSWRGLGYGYGWSLAKENICSMADIYTTVRGERSKYFGPEGKWMLTGNGIEFTNLESDFAHKRVIAEKTIPKVLKMKPPNGPLPQVQGSRRRIRQGLQRLARRRPRARSRTRPARASPGSGRSPRSTPTCASTNSPPWPVRVPRLTESPTPRRRLR